MLYGSGGSGQQLAAPRRPAPDPLPLFREEPAPVLTSDDLFAIYRLVLENYVDQVEPEVLIEGALKGLQRGGEEFGLLPIDLAIVENTPLRYTRDPERDWARFASRYDALLDKQGGRIGIGAIGPATAKGMLDALDDPHTAYLDRESLQRQARGIVGIGVILSSPDRRGAPIIREV